VIQPPSSTSDHPSPTEETNPQSPEPLKIMVDVKGMVKYPGVYELPAGSRMIDAIEIAGGYLPESDSISINHAQILNDEMAIYIPYKGEEAVAAVQLIQAEADDGKVNINTADETMLTSLPGIGPSKAKAIVSFREDNGLFTSPEDLKKVTGIGDKTYEQLKDLIKIN
jgi:competence protein ComEA